MNDSRRRLYLALDQGGHSSRALLFDAGGECLAAGKRAVSTAHTADDRVEHDPTELTDTLREAAIEVLEEAGVGGDRPVVAGLATQRSSLVCWDRPSGAPRSPVISWQDRRAAAWLEELAPRGGELEREIYATTGLAVSPHYGASKYRWCLERLPTVRRARAAGRLALGPLAGYLAQALTREGRFVVDPANAARTQLCALATGRWSDRLLDLFGVPGELLPEIVPNRYRYGTLELDRRDVPLELVTGDQSAALFGFGRPARGQVSINAGTGGFLQTVVVDRSTAVPGLLTATVHEDGGGRTYSVEGSVNGCAAALDWAADELGVERSTVENELDRWAIERVDPPLFLNGVSGLGSPYWIADFESRFVDLRARHRATDRLVAVLESIVFLLVENLAALDAAGIEVSRLLVTGGLASSDSFCGKLAALAARPLVRPEAPEATARGVAWLLGCEAIGGPEVADVGSAGETPVDAALADRFAAWRGVMASALAG